MKPTLDKTEDLDALSKKGTCIEFFSAYQDFDINRMMSLCAASGNVAFVPLGDAGKGRLHETGKAIWSALMDAFPDLDNTVKAQTFNEKDNTVTCAVTIFGTQKKDFGGIPAKGLRFDNDHIFIFRFDEQGKIENLNIVWDHDRFVKLLTGV